MRRRSAFEISMAVLISINDGNNRITRIMSDANTSHVPLIILLKALEQGGFIGVDEDSGKDERVGLNYWVTDSGVKLVNMYKDLLKIWNKAFIGAV